MIGKRLINTGVAAADALVPSENFNTVLYTGNGSTQRIGGYINRGAVFNGTTSSYIDYAPLEGFFHQKQTFTLSLWFYTSSTNSGGGTLFTDYAVQSFNILAYIQNSNIIVESRYNSAGTTYTSSATYLNAWTHLCVTSDGTTRKVYVNGSLESTQTLSTNGWTSSYSDNRVQSGALRNDANNTQNNPYNGKLDQVRIFNKALSSSEVTTLYGETHASTTISTTDIFSDNSGVALYQLDGNANDTGGVTGRTEGTESAIFSNADNSNFNLGNATVVNNSFGVSFWVKMNKISQSENVYLCSFMYGSNTSLYMDTSNVLQVSNGGYSRNESFSTTHTFAADTWYHIVYTGQIVGDGTLRCYVNGTQVGSRGWITGHNYTLTSGNRIGSYNNGDQSIDGQIADFRIYKSTHLSSSDVTALYSGTPPTTGLTEYYKFDGNDRNYAGDRQLTPSNVIYNYSGTATNLTYQEATKFTPDLVWLKDRSAAGQHGLFDSVRGANLWLHSETTSAETDYSGNYGVLSFNSNGFSIGNGSAINTNNNNYVGWCFNAGDGAAASVSNGTNTSSITQKANQDGGFSITKFSGTSTATGNFPHGLSSTPEMVIVKTTSNADSWFVWHKDLTSAAYAVRLNTTAAESSNNAFWNSTAPDTTNVTLGGGILVSGWDYVAYCFHSVDGYSKIGSYTGTGTTNGNFVETGFEPAFVMVKRTDGGAQNWVMFDNKRSTTNPRTKKLAANLSSDENNSGTIGTDAQDNLDFYADGFRPVTSNNHTNISGGTFIYLAIAADPDTTTPTVENSFDVVTYTGDGVNAKSVDVDFKPDLVWIKSRTSALSNVIHDSIRGSGPLLITDSTTAEINNGSNTVEFTEDGFDLQGGASHSSVNGADDFVAWCWKAGDHDDNLPQINTEGTIDSVVSVNADAGFSIVKYTGNGTAGATVGHGLSSAPDLIIAKGLETASAYNWMVYASPATTSLGKTAEHGHAYLNLTNAYEEPIDPNIKSIWNDTAPTSTVFSISDNVNINANGAYIAYCFHSVSGYQKIGSYTGTGSSGNAVTTGFQPRWVMIKNTASGYSWIITDSTRQTGKILYPNLSSSEFTLSTGITSFDSNGFTLGTDVSHNNSGDTFIYLAIA